MLVLKTSSFIVLPCGGLTMPLNERIFDDHLIAQANLTCLVREVRYNVNLETRDEDVVWIGEHGPYRHHIG